MSYINMPFTYYRICRRGKILPNNKSNHFDVIFDVKVTTFATWHEFKLVAKLDFYYI